MALATPDLGGPTENQEGKSKAGPPIPYMCGSGISVGPSETEGHVLGHPLLLFPSFP